MVWTMFLALYYMLSSSKIVSLLHRFHVIKKSFIDPAYLSQSVTFLLMWVHWEVLEKLTWDQEVSLEELYI
jgi:hypothetical protein